MTQDEFEKLAREVVESPPNPPEMLFEGGVEDWHARVRLAHFLAMPSFGRMEEAAWLLRSALDAEVDEENAEDVEERVFALQKLSELERDAEGGGEDALRHISSAIELAESTDFLYKFILRGELWGDRWNIMHRLGMAREAEEEADERIEAYQDIPIDHNSYLYYGYRFKAMLAAEQGLALVAKDYMHMALHAMEIPEEYREGLDLAFSAKHENAAWILNEIDRATPNPNQLHWDI